jgi:outer membrane receptor protein involved in Fe transport
VIYGDYAFQGLINIVTRVEREIVASVDSYDGRSLDWLFETRLGDAQVSTALGWRNTGEAILPIGRDAREQTRSLIVQAEQGGWRLLAQGEQRRLGEVRGGPPDPGQSDTSYTAVGEYTTEFSESARLRAYAQFLANDVDTGVVRLGPNTFGLGFDGRQWRGGLDAVFERDKITWLAGLDGLWGFIDEAVYRGLPRAIGQPPSPIRISDKRRRVAGAYLQAQLALSERLQLTLGARYDHNGDVGSRTTPRISLVWRPADRHVLKAQYAEGYRSPTFFEIYGDGTASSSLDFEVNATSELSYVYRRAGQTFRATAFRSRIDDMVFIDSRVLRFRNVGRAASDGLELEWDGSIAPQWRWRGSLSYSDAEDNRNAFLQTTRLTRNPDWQGGVGVIWRPIDRFSLAAQLVHVGERDASTIGDGGYQRFDVSAHWRGIGQLPLDMRLGVDNVGNARIAQIVTGPTEQTTIAFQDRIAWVSLGWRFE